MNIPSRHPIETIHHINRAFNRIFSVPLYFAGFAMTALLLVSPYWLRMLLAFAVNAFFNRPSVYLSYFSQTVGKRMQFAVFTVAYLTVFGAYAAGFALKRGIRGKVSGTSGWKPVGIRPDADSYYFQS